MTMLNGLICFVLVTSSCLSSVNGSLFNRSDSAGVQYIDGLYWSYARLRPVVDGLASSPTLRIWLNGVIEDELAISHGMTTIIADGNRYPRLRQLIRSRIVRWIVFLAILKVAAGLFVIVVLPNIYFMAMTMMEWDSILSFKCLNSRHFRIPSRNDSGV